MCSSITRRSGRSLGWLVATAMSLSCASGVWAAAVTFTDITPAGANDFLPSGFFEPSINAAGQVAMYGRAIPGSTGVYTNRNGGRLSLLVAESGNDLGSFLTGKAIIDDAGGVTYFKAGSVNNLVRDNGSGTVTLITPPASGFYFHQYQPQGSGIIVSVHLDGESSGSTAIVSIPTPGTNNILVKSEGTPFRFTLAPRAADNGRYAFKGELDNGVEGIYTGPDPVADRFVDETDSRWSELSAAAAFGGVAMSRNGRILFDGTPSAGPRGLFTSADPTTSRIAAFGSGSPYSTLLDDEFAINSSGAVLFHARTAAGAEAIYAGANPATDRIIGVGDSLFGGTIGEISFAGNAMNDNGDFVFSYQLVNGGAGVAIGHLPEPTSALIVLPLIALIGRGRARRVHTA